MHILTPFIITALLASNTLAQLCTLSVASSWEVLLAAAASASTSSSNTGFSGKTESEFEMDLTNANNAALSGGSNLISNAASKKRQNTTSTLTCTSTEACLYTKSKLLMCANLKTFDFHDVEVAKGNFVTGDYTLKNGTKGNLFAVPTSTSAGAAGGSATASMEILIGTATAAVVQATPTTTSTGGAGRDSMGSLFAVSLPIAVVVALM